MDKEDKLSTEPYKGVRDFYPADWAQMNAMFGVVRGVLAARGYEEYQASPLERSELYESKGNEEIVNEQTYTFQDRGERMVTLRPEMTPTLARMVAGKRRELPFPLRWFSIGNRFRYERPQKGRLREFYQADIDLVGLPEGEADIEVMKLATTVLGAFGAASKDYIVRVNYRPLLVGACKAAGLAGEAARQYLRLLDKKAKMPGEEYKAAVAALTKSDPLALIESGDERIKPAKDAVDAIIRNLKERGVDNAVFDPTLARGFDYYTGVVFEIFDTNPENPRALFGGGRYDGLVALFGGEPIPAVGFAFGDVTLMDFLTTHGLVPASDAAPQLYIGTVPTKSDDESTRKISEPLANAARKAAERFSKAGVRTFLNITDRSTGDQIRDALRRGIPYFFAYGADEAATDTVRLKDLATSTEEVIAIEALISKLQK